MFSSSEIVLKDNSNNIRDIFESMECTDTFLFDVRNLQSSNVTWYDLSDTAINNSVRLVSSL